jgi:hypothetical protein
VALRIFGVWGLGDIHGDGVYDYFEKCYDMHLSRGDAIEPNIPVLELSRSCAMHGGSIRSVPRRELH